jgi:uracil-DNA glycosylase
MDFIGLNMRHKILLVGSNPSIRSSTSEAFSSTTKSANTLSLWIKDIDADFIFINVSDIKTPKNRPLSQKEIKKSLPSLDCNIKKMNADKYVALGKAAHIALTLLGLDHLEMPHPSGMNRLLNDSNYRDKKINELATFATSSLE